MDKITWGDCSPLEKKSAIGLVESSLGVKFPSAFTDIVRTCNGGSPSRTLFSVDTQFLGTVEAAVGALLSFNENDESYILKNLELLKKDGFIERIIPFADEGGGNFLCFDFREGDVDPKILYWIQDFSLEDNPEAALNFVANSFSEFLNLLEEDENIDDFDE